MKKITVIGSISTDLVVETSQLPKIGETIEGDAMTMSFGGKGANQAVAAARLGANVAMVGTVGLDDFGGQLIANLETNRILTEGVKRVTYSSGTAIIQLYNNDNSIIYVPGANNAITTADIDAVSETLLSSELVLIQNEIQQAVVEYVIEFCHQHKIQIVLNPAPARPIKAEHLEMLDYLTPNETEYEVIFPGQVMSETLAAYPNKLIVTHGAEGVYYHDGTQVVNVAGYKVEQVVDTTGAGDCFNGALSTAIVSGLNLKAAIQFANLAASISIQKLGAQTGSPSLAKIKDSEHYETKWDIEQ